MALFTDLGNGFSEYLDGNLYSVNSVTAINKTETTITMEFSDESILVIPQTVWELHYATLELATAELFTVFTFSGSSGGGNSSGNGASVGYVMYSNPTYTNENSLNFSGGTITLNTVITNGLTLSHKNTSSVFTDGTDLIFELDRIYEVEVIAVFDLNSSNTTIRCELISVNGGAYSLSTVSSSNVGKQNYKFTFQFVGTQDLVDNNSSIRIKNVSSNGGGRIYNIKVKIKDYGEKVI